MARAKVGFEVDWQLGWPEPNAVLNRLGRSPAEDEVVTVFPDDVFPDDHPIVLIYTGYFDDR